MSDRFDGGISALQNENIRLREYAEGLERVMAQAHDRLGEPCQGFGAFANRFKEVREMLMAAIANGKPTASIPTGTSCPEGECGTPTACTNNGGPLCVNEIDTQKPAPRECHNGTACTSWDCTYPNCTFPPKKPEAPLQRDTQTAKSVGALMVTVPDRLPPTAVPRVVAAWHQVANWSVIDLVEHIYAVGVAAAKEAEETHRT
jgi:hypothetical protein